MIMAGLPPVILSFGNSIAANGTNGKSGNHDAAGRGEPAKHSEKFHNIRVLAPKSGAIYPGRRRILPGTGRSGQPAGNGPGLQWLYTVSAETYDCFFVKKV